MFWKIFTRQKAVAALEFYRRREESAKQNGAGRVRAVIQTQSLTTEMSGASTAFMPTTW